MFVCSSSQPVSFESCRLVLPCISVGNVGQLTADLLINSLKLVRVGYLHDDGLLPLVGNDAFDHLPQPGHLHTSAEVYFSGELRIAVVQTRAPVAKGFQQSFCSNMLQWVREGGFSEIILLTSSHAHERKDSQIRGSPFRFLLSPSCSDLYPLFTEDLKWTTLEPRSQGALPSPLPPGSLEESSLFLPGSGLARRLYLEACSSGVHLVALTTFCSQGDNIPDAIGLASYLDQWLQLQRTRGTRPELQKVWQCPSSWSLMYGGPSPENIY